MEWKKIPIGRIGGLGGGRERERESLRKSSASQGDFQVHYCSLHDVIHVSPSANSAVFTKTLV